MVKLGILSESPVDEAALMVLAEAVLGAPFSRVIPALRARGWPSVIQVLPAVIRHLHFNTDADGLIVVVDSDDSVVHTPEHDAPGYYHPKCRMCQLRGVFRKTVKNLPPAHNRNRLLRGVGLAVPAMEAWYLCGTSKGEGVTEEAWVKGQESGRQPYSRADLKAMVYGVRHPSLPFAMRRAVEEVKRQAHDLRRLENDFPCFASLANDLRSWKTAREKGKADA